MKTALRARADYAIITGWVAPGSSVLDLGCGDGELLAYLNQKKQTKGQGIEIDNRAIYSCVAKGLNVFQGDIDSGLAEFQDKSFDYVILNQSLQQVRHFDRVFQDVLRVGRNVIVGFPNFAYYKSRFQLFFKGRAPVTPSLPYDWHESPNLHFLSITDFWGYCRRSQVRIEKKAFINGDKKVWALPNLLANIGIFMISK